MGIRHLMVDATDPYERGRQRGHQGRERLRETWPIYQRLFEFTAEYSGRPPVALHAVAEACLERTAAWAPDLARELEGVSQGADLDLLDVVALNARTEVLALARGAGATECSTVVQMEGAEGTALGTQTWDWHHDLAEGWHAQTVRGDEHTFVGLAEYGMLAKIGVNDAGLGVHFNLLRHASDVAPEYDDHTAPFVGGVPVHLLAREVLGRAATLSEALDLLRSAPIASSTVLTVLTPGEAACVEVCPAGVGVVTPSDGWLVHTNHFLDPPLARGERVNLDITTTFERHDLLQSRVRSVAHPLDIERLVDVLCLHDEEGAAVCRHLDAGAAFGFRSASLATVGIDPFRRLCSLSAWGPCRRTGSLQLVATSRDVAADRSGR